IEELEKVSVYPKESASAGVVVRYSEEFIPDPDDPKRKRPGLKLRITLEHAEQEVPFGPYYVPGLDLMLATGALHGTIEAARVLEVEENASRLARAPARTFVEGNAVLAEKGSPYGLEVLVGDKARPPKDRQGVALVELNKDEVYTIRLINR